jgi:hypothetical protein
VEQTVPLRIKNFVLGEDYPEVCEWWREQGFAYVPPRLLSPLGIVISDADGIKYCAAWVMCVALTKWGLLEFLVANPGVPMRRKVEAIHLLVDTAKETAKAAGVEVLTSFTAVKGLARLLEKKGFRAGNKVTELYARL